MDTSTWLGTAGVACLLVAFFLNLFGFLGTEKRSYLLLNLFGAGLSAWASWMIQFIPFVVLEITWMVVAGGGVVKRLHH